MACWARSTAVSKGSRSAGVQSITVSGTRPSPSTRWTTASPGAARYRLRSDSCRSSSTRSASTTASVPRPAGTGTRRESTKNAFTSGRKWRMSSQVVSWPQASGAVRARPPPKEI